MESEEKIFSDELVEEDLDTENLGLDDLPV